MKREDLTTKLQDQYNTLSFSIQDPEAFHHDVYEISNIANNSSQFHRLMSDRKEQRLRELNDGLESASLEIIANPSLIGTQQWQHAVQLFRTKSLDSLVRYFSSYLPESHPWYRCAENWTQDQPLPTFTDMEDGCAVTDEPLPISASIKEDHLPLSPRSLTMCSDGSSVVDDFAHQAYEINTLTPARTLSFSEPETDMMVLSGTLSGDFDDETSQFDDPDTPTTSVSDLSETRSLPESHDAGDELRDEAIASIDAQGAEDADAADSETPTPRNEAPSDSYLTQRSTAKDGPSSPLYTHVLQEYVRSSRRSRGDGTPGVAARRKSPDIGRVQKPPSGPIRQRPKVGRHD